MTQSDIERNDDSSAAVRAEAAAWLARLHGPGRNAEFEAGLQRWLREQPANARAFERMTDSWELATSVAAGHLPRRTVRERPATSLRWALVAGVAAIGILVAVAVHLMARAPSYATLVGEQRTVRLDDGSRISLNSLSRIVVDYSRRERLIRLEEGEAYFEVASNPRRPFVVLAGSREVTAVGTTFTVRQEPDRFEVTLLEGKVIVSSEEHASPTVTLQPGQRLTWHAQSEPRIDTPAPASVAAWRRGEIMLDRTTLAEAAREMNRYDQTRLVIDDAAVAGLLIGGIFRTGDNLSFARAMAEMHHLRLVRVGSEIRLLPGPRR
jgi:transmembrane sensor